MFKVQISLSFFIFNVIFTYKQIADRKGITTLFILLVHNMYHIFKHKRYIFNFQKKIYF